MKAVSVIPFKKGVLNDNLTYFSAKDIPDGSIVSISIRNKKILGLTISSEEVVNIKSKIKELDFDLKKIIDVKGISIFRKEFLDSAILASKYFASNKSNLISFVIPSAFKEGYDKISKIINGTQKENAFEKKEILKMKPEKLLFQAPFSERISFYKTLIRESFAKKKSIFIVLPTEHDIDIFSESLFKGIENFAISIHGGLTHKKQIENMEKILTSEHPMLILGTVPYLSIPRYDLETIIIENENSSAYKTIGKNHLDFRIFAEIFASKINAKFILADSLLRFETTARREIDNFSEIHPLSFRLNFNGEIEFPPKTDSKFKILTNETLKEIQNSIAKKENVFIFTLRKGLATTTICKDCNETVNCTKCMAPIVLYLSRDGNKRMFVCNKCGEEMDPRTRCTNCGGWNLMPLGIGTQTVFEEIKTFFPENKIFKLDKESAKTKKQAEKIVDDFEESSGAILIGTEMALFYLKNKIPLSIIASFDSLWSIPNFKISEKIIQILTSIISKTEKRFIIETKNEKDLAVKSIINENLLSFVRDELEDRKKLGYPPYKRFIKITYFGDKENTINTKKTLSEFFKDYNPEIFSGFISKQKNKYITNILIKVDTNKWSLPEISSKTSIDQNLLNKLISLPPSFYINIDPEDLL
ncbi:MAG TPA: hypothetical protein PKZ36_01835 [Candidatus Paceibacterota bacterium]|nr:hypothetical protein [Candidatus Paceibacterota bacterium]HPT18127.1 hypothetical protein [Candidatus Paceibacterota bacterium]